MVDDDSRGVASALVPGGRMTDDDSGCQIGAAIMRGGRLVDDDSRGVASALVCGGRMANDDSGRGTGAAIMRGGCLVDDDCCGVASALVHGGCLANDDSRRGIGTALVPGAVLVRGGSRGVAAAPVHGGRIGSLVVGRFVDDSGNDFDAHGRGGRKAANDSGNGMHTSRHVAEDDVHCKDDCGRGVGDENVGVDILLEPTVALAMALPSPVCLIMRHMTLIR